MENIIEMLYGNQILIFKVVRFFNLFLYNVSPDNGIEENCTLCTIESTLHTFLSVKILHDFESQNNVMQR